MGVVKEPLQRKNMFSLQRLAEEWRRTTFIPKPGNEQSQVISTIYSLPVLHGSAFPLLHDTVVIPFSHILLSAGLF